MIYLLYFIYPIIQLLLLIKHLVSLKIQSIAATKESKVLDRNYLVAYRAKLIGMFSGILVTSGLVAVIMAFTQLIVPYKIHVAIIILILSAIISFIVSTLTFIMIMSTIIRHIKHKQEKMISDGVQDTLNKFTKS